VADEFDDGRLTLHLCVTFLSYRGLHGELLQFNAALM